MPHLSVALALLALLAPSLLKSADAAQGGQAVHVPPTHSDGGTFWTSAGVRRIGEPIQRSAMVETMQIQDYVWIGPLYLDLRGFKHGGSIQVTGVDDDYKGEDKMGDGDPATTTFYKHSLDLLLVPQGTDPPTTMAENVNLYKHGGAWGSSGEVAFNPKTGLHSGPLPSVTLPFFGPKVYCLYYGVDHYRSHDMDYKCGGIFRVVVTHKW